MVLVDHLHTSRFLLSMIFEGGCIWVTEFFVLAISQHFILGARLHVYENSRYVLGYIKTSLALYTPPQPVRWVSTLKLNELCS
jgi:hypothetical protein